MAEAGMNGHSTAPEVIEEAPPKPTLIRRPIRVQSSEEQTA
jgi:hypothetical protein